MTPAALRRSRRPESARLRVRGGWWDAVGSVDGALAGIWLAVFSSLAVAVGEAGGDAKMVVVSAAWEVDSNPQVPMSRS